MHGIETMGTVSAYIYHGACTCSMNNVCMFAGVCVVCARVCVYICVHVSVCVCACVNVTGFSKINHMGVKAKSEMTPA